jgi:2-methylcitrate dehydratase PrpD
VDGIIELQRTHRSGLDDVEQVDIATYRASVEITNRQDVATVFDGRFSTPFCIANALKHGSVRLAAFSEARIGNMELNALGRRVRMSIDPECDAAFPRARSAKVAVTLRDGSRLTHFQRTRKGDPDAPLTDQELGDKFIELVEPCLGRSAAASFLRSLYEVGTGSDINWRFATLDGS